MLDIAQILRTIPKRAPKSYARQLREYLSTLITNAEEAAQSGIGPDLPGETSRLIVATDLNLEGDRIEGLQGDDVDLAIMRQIAGRIVAEYNAVLEGIGATNANVDALQMEITDGLKRFAVVGGSVGLVTVAIAIAVYFALTARR